MLASVRNSKLMFIVENFIKGRPSSQKPVINVQKVKIIKSDINQKMKMKGRKLNFRLKDFTSNKKPGLGSHSISKNLQSDSKTNKSCILQVKTNDEYNGEISSINMSNYNTNSQVVHPCKNKEKGQARLFQLRKRMLGN